MSVPVFILNLLNFVVKSNKSSACLPFYLFSPTHLINSIIHEHLRSILYIVQVPLKSNLQLSKPAHQILVHVLIGYAPSHLKGTATLMITMFYMKDLNEP